jgi:homoserine dehydrogenase
MWLGAGAGGAATASAVIGDIVAAARNRVDGRYDRVVARPAPDLLPLGEIQSVFYLSLDVLDRPGVLASVAGIFGDHGVSIKSMEQSGFGDEARLMFLTHLGFEVDVAATIEDLATLEVVDRVGSCIRVLGTGDG